MSAQSKPTISPWGRAVAGATGAVLANSLVYPLDIVKTRLQVQVRPGVNDDFNTTHYSSTWDAITRIVADDGIQGLYAGMSGSLVGVASTNFAYFYWYTIARTVYTKSVGPSANSPSTAIELSLGAAAGALAQLFTIPVAVVTTRQQTASKEERKGLLATAQEVIEGPDGISGLWRGLKASLVLVVNPAITYGAYERLKDVFFPGKTNLKPWEAFALGAMSKALATIMTQPLIVAKVGLQSKPPPSRNGKHFSSFIEVMRFIIHHEGALSLFKGIGPQIFKGLLVQGILMMTKESGAAIYSFYAIFKDHQPLSGAPNRRGSINGHKRAAEIAHRETFNNFLDEVTPYCLRSFKLCDEWIGLIISLALVIFEDTLIVYQSSLFLAAQALMVVVGVGLILKM